MACAANKVNTANFKLEQQEQEQKHFETGSPLKI